MAANNEDTTRADERVEETAEQAVTQTAADTAAGAVQPERTPASDDAADAPEEPSAPTLQVDPTDPFAVPANLIEVLRTETTSRQRSEDEDAGESEDRAEGAVVSRRRRRRRRGEVDMELDGGEAGDPEHTVTRVRAPRQAVSTASDTVQSVKGSTRLEAKRQRRRDSRSGGRRRTVITEAEFLARREAVDRKMLVRQRDQRIQIAVLEDGVLAEHFVSHTTQDSMIGNVYLGKVQNVLPSMEAAFVDIGRGRNAVLYAGEVNWDAAQLDGKPRKIENALKSGDTVLVQVTKDPVGHKGARLTSQVSLPGRYLVYVPGGSMTGISRKLPDVERSRLKKILKDHLPQDAGVIVRTAAEGTSEQELQNDINRLRAQWEGIQEKASGTKVLAPELLYAEPDLTIKTVRDVFNEDFSAMLVQGEATWDNIEAYVTYVAPHLLDRLHHWVPEDHDGEDLYATHRVDEQLHKALERKVYLPSGGSLVIDRTEAMTVVDVNTGKFTGSGGNLEETVTKNNLEAAEEIVRQLRLRDIGGIIVIDFIDMVLEANRDLVLRRLVECLGRDRTKHQVAEVTSLGLVQMTRKRMGTGLVEVFSETCEHCAGRGIIIKDTPVERGRSGGEQRGEAEGRRRRRRRGNGEGEHAHAAAATTTGAEHVDSEDERQRRERAEAARVALHSIAKASGKVAEDETPAQEPAPAEQAADAAEDSVAEAVEAASAGPAKAGQPAGADEEETPRRRRRRGRRRGRGRTEESGDTGAEVAGSEDAARSHDDGPAESADQPRQTEEEAEPAAAEAPEHQDPVAQAEEAESPEDADAQDDRPRRSRRRRGGRGRSRRDGEAASTETDAEDQGAERATPSRHDAADAESSAAAPAEDASEPVEDASAPVPAEDALAPRRRRSRRASSDGVVRPAAGADASAERTADRTDAAPVEATEPSPEESTDATEVHEQPAAPAAVEEAVMVEPAATEPTAEPTADADQASAADAPTEAQAAPAPGSPRRRSRRAVSSDGVHVQVQAAPGGAQGGRFTAAVAEASTPAEPQGAAPVMLGVGVKAADLARRGR
ncbi:Rne/Rng family ribonuclease [Micrococcus luteus]|uniref:Ribonuclease E n=2 Tax=Micrococcaceae TaxID=1268 RepID=A0ABR6CXX7_9MICC|nr:MULTISPECIES: Rne/Rng family ribonuclease [Micrococcus]MCV7471793.1 Rne/Rng family ribonuclease [Micrococcus luteus]MBA9058687.1 ribonuclease E [Micrococcus yunnanensis]MCV7486312.1 Rne/Rng family ribonuclease [Micrococcus luteus]MCV7494680.1 Rne/Rng family ribonuclease [Micrococcus luteus]MCV7598922.1 Rne/Rng family ribonuclease [Micrococcus luteus]